MSMQAQLAELIQAPSKGKHAHRTDDSAFMTRLAAFWESLSSDADRLWLQGDHTAPLRAMVLAGALAEGDIVSPEQARALLYKSSTPE